MTRDELIALLEKHEWRDVEFKEAQREVPRDAYDSVSAFANTEGGHLVFGVRKHGNSFAIVGVLDVDKVQNEFLTTLRQPDKISVILDVQEELHQHEGSALLIFYVPEASRAIKPVYLNGDIRRSFVRKGACDIRCSKEERDRFLIDAAAERYDSQAVEVNVHTAFDPESLRWYRGVYEGRPNNKSYADLLDLDFLFEMGLLVERTNTRLPTRAAVMLFGTDGVVRQLLPRPVVDCQRFGLPFEQAATGARWMDRIVVEENLIRTWRRLLDWYQKLAEQPFRVDVTTLQRDDMPADYIAFREATVNLLSHQDYADHTRKAEMRTYQDQTVFWNPGDAFATVADLLEPGEKEVRNPRIVSAFRRIGLSEHAGWGLRDVFRNWQQLGRIPLRITNDKARKAFALTLLKEELLSEEQLLFHAQLGVHLSEQEARVFAYACRVEELSIAEVKVLTSLGTSEAQKVADHLTLQVLLQPIEDGQRYALAAHLRERFQTDRIDLVSDQVRREGQNLSTAQVGVQEGNLSTAQDPLLRELSDTQWHLVDMCEIPRRLADIMTALGVSNRGFFKQHHLDPLIQAGVICMTNPDKPRSSNQKYILTEAGAQIRARRLKEGNGE